MSSPAITPEVLGLGLGLGFFLLIALCLLASLGLFALWLWMLIDCATAPEPPGSSNHRLVWILVLVFTGWLGALIYFFAVRRPRLLTSRAAPPLPPTLPG
jgi:hypothetical protein